MSKENSFRFGGKNGILPIIEPFIENKVNQNVVYICVCVSVCARARRICA